MLTVTWLLPTSHIPQQWLRQRYRDAGADDACADAEGGARGTRHYSIANCGTRRCSSAASVRPGRHKLMTDAYAVMAGFDGIAYPAEGIVALAARSVVRSSKIMVPSR